MHELIPIDRELQERLDWFTRLRWLACIGIVAGGGIAPFIAPELSRGSIFLVALLVGLYNLAFTLIARRLGRMDGLSSLFCQSVHGQIFLDWLALAALVHYTGGIHSPVSLAFPFHLIIASILLPVRACYVHAAVASLLVGVLGYAEVHGYWPPPAVALVGVPSDEAAATLHRWVALSTVFFIAVYLTTSISSRLRQKEEELVASEHELGRAYREVQLLNQERL